MDDTLSLDLQQTDFGREIDNEIRRLDGRIDTEAETREAAEREIWTEIEAIEVASDVVDVVGTKAELDSYDTSTLKDNDIIKVLADETHDDAIAYYRWSTSTNTFTFIGVEGPYYTASETDTLLADKQDKLIAGANIQIAADGKTISATDTTYTAGTGISITDGIISNTSAEPTLLYMTKDGTYYKLYRDSSHTILVTHAEMVGIVENGSVYIIDDNSVSTPIIYSVYQSYVIEATMPQRTVIHFLLYNGSGGNGTYDYAWSSTDVGATVTYTSNQKQLIPGANIQINGTTISATDTTYSNFVGTDGTAAGTAGLVPAPATTDAGKYLKSDGTWGAISIPTVTLYSGTGQNTDGAMTQKAVTDTLFESNDTARIKIGSGVVNSGANSVVIGSQDAQVLTPNSVAIGNGGTTAGRSGGTGYNVAIGSYGIISTGGQSVAIGGYGAQATAQGTIAIGTNGALASGVSSIAIGSGGHATHENSVALGAGATTSRASEVSIGKPNETKYIANVTAGVNVTDAVNVAQLKIGLLSKQDTLTAGTGISIDANNVISATGGVANNISSEDWSALWQ